MMRGVDDLILCRRKTAVRNVGDCWKTQESSHDLVDENVLRHGIRQVGRRSMVVFSGG